MIIIKNHHNKKKNNSITIFICHTAFHHYICTQLIEQNFKNSKLEVWKTYDGLARNRYAAYCSYITKFYKLINRKKQLESWLNEGIEIKLLVPHIGGVLQNYAYNVLAMRYCNLSIDIYYDGQGMLFEERPLEKKSFKWIKSIVSAAVGFNYSTPNHLLMPFYDTRISNCYSPIPEETIYTPTQKIRHFNMTSENFEPDLSCAMVVEQELWGYTGSNIADMNFRMIDDLISCGCTNIFYKTRPESNGSLLTAIKNRYVGKNRVIILNVNETAEQICRIYKIGRISSFWSSVLLHASLMMPNVIVHSYIPKTYMNDDRIKRLYNIYNRIGVEVTVI